MLDYFYYRTQINYYFLIDCSHVCPQELAKHCRRETRGAAETEALLDELLTAFMGDIGCATIRRGPPEAHLGAAEGPRGMHPGSARVLPLQAGRQQVERGRAPTRVPLRERIDLAGELPSPPEQIHPR